MISILFIVPTLNSYEYLPPLVNSLRKQSLDCWRVLFIDGHSTEDHRNWLTRVCREDPRFQWQPQWEREKGIYGAMNQGFQLAKNSNDWVLFWGSDDRAASPTCLEKAVRILEDMKVSDREPDLCVCRGKYFSDSTNKPPNQKVRFTRTSKFLWRRSLAHSLFLGSSPPHQATLFGPGARRLLNRYDISFSLAADLDYFLRISRFNSVRIVNEDIDLVLMGNSGISAQQNGRRLREVSIAYRQRFGIWWYIPFVLRYLQRFHSLVRI